MGLANTIPHAGKCGIVWRTSRNACRSDYYPDHVVDRRKPGRRFDSVRLL